MTHDNKLGLPDALDEAPDGIGTFIDAAFVAVAAVVGVLGATLVATLAAPVGPGIGLLALFVGWPLGFLAAAVVLRAGLRAVARSGVTEFVRDRRRRAHASTHPVTDGGRPDEMTCNCQ